MHRKQALLKAIKILEETPGNEDVVEKLQDILSELPLSAWTQKSVIDSIESYAYEHDNTLPSTSELITANKLPSNTQIKYLFKTSSMVSFFNEYFPHLKSKPKQLSKYDGMSKECLINIFKENYERIKNEFDLKTVSNRMYRAYKAENAPCIETVMKKCGCKTYDELLILCGYKRSKKPISVSINATIYTDETEASKYLKKVIDEHQEDSAQKVV